MNKLLILDVSGVLCCKMKAQGLFANIDVSENGKLETIDLNYYKLVIRPGVYAFLDYCYKHFTVGFFSSTTQPNVDTILVHLLTREQIEQTAFVWYRDHTHYDYQDLAGIKTIKKLEDVLDNPMANPMVSTERMWHKYNSLMVDDSISKMRFNDAANVLICPSFTGANDDSILERLIVAIEDKFLQLERK